MLCWRKETLRRLPGRGDPRHKVLMNEEHFATVRRKRARLNTSRVRASVHISVAHSATCKQLSMTIGQCQ